MMFRVLPPKTFFERAMMFDHVDDTRTYRNTQTGKEGYEQKNPQPRFG